ncbi:hypothetical protein BGW39_006198 [Mortierella sp. 14UC]|nr:hypothetical protein BGW39_006198 [Mortierella sp. 14UC]
MKESMAAKVLSLPEIVFRIGMWIPVWITPKERDSTQKSTHIFRPKDLVAAIAVNRLFHITLTPLLWTVYTKAAINPNGFIYNAPSKDPSPHPHPRPMRPENQLTLATLNANCSHIRYLELDAAHGYFRFHPAMFQFQNCTRLRELKLPSFKLQMLELQEWRLDALHLARILDNNCNTLQRLDLIAITLIQGVAMKSTWNGPQDSALAGLEKQKRTEAEKWTIGRPLVLPNLKTLYLAPYWEFTVGQLVADLLGAMPALETLHVQPEPGLDMLPLSQALLVLMTSKSEQVVQITNLLEACVPGNLTHLRVSVALLDDALTATLLAYMGTLETLDITLASDADTGMKNLARVLEQCPRLKRFSLQNYRFWQPAQEAARILEAFKPDHLESLTLTGFLSEDYDQNETDDEDEDDLDDVHVPFVLDVPDLPPRNRQAGGECDSEDENAWETDDDEDVRGVGSSSEHPEDHLFDISHNVRPFDPSLARVERDMTRVFSNEEEEEQDDYKEEEKPKGKKKVSDTAAGALSRTIVTAFISDRPSVKEMVLNCEVYKKTEPSG